MKKRIAYLFIFISLLCAFLSVFAAADTDPDTFTISQAFQPDYDISWWGSGVVYDNYIVQYKIDGSNTWVPLIVSHSTEYPKLPRFLSGQVRVLLLRGVQIISTSNSLTINNRPVILVDISNGNLLWDQADGALSYTVQKLNYVNNTWSDIVSFDGSHEPSAFDDRFFGNRLRVKYTFNGYSVYSVEFSAPAYKEITWESSFVFPWDTSNRFPTLDSFPEQSIDYNAAKASTGYLFSGVLHTKLFPYAAAALGLMISFAVVSYFAFRMH